MKIIYFSPHLDDVAFSCGGHVWQQVEAGHEVSIWTIFAGDPLDSEFSEFAKKLHQKWNLGVDAVSMRRSEEQISCEILGASYFHWILPDCIYRRNSISNEHLYISDKDLFADLQTIEEELISETAQKLREKIDSESILIAPLTIGNHVDHQICRKIVEKIRKPDHYYLDYPYIDMENFLNQKLYPQNYSKKLIKLSYAAINRWQDSVEAHNSQISSFWENSEKMREEIKAYVDQNRGLNMISKK